MEQKHVILSALSVGVGVGVGLLSSGQSVTKWVKGTNLNTTPEFISGDQIEHELLRLVSDGRDSNVTLEDFPYYLSERTKVLLTSAAMVHLRHAEFSKHTRNLSPASRAILLSGPAEIYHQMLAKALAHHFKSKLLLLDVSAFSLKMQSKYGCAKRESSSSNRSISEAALERVSTLFSSFSALHSTAESKSTLDVKSRATEGTKHSTSWCFDEKDFVQSLHKVIASKSESRSIILYIRDVERILLQSERFHGLFRKMMEKLSGSVVILGSRESSMGKDEDNKLSGMFPYSIEIKPPEDETHLLCWKAQMEEDMRAIRSQDNRNHISEALAANDLECDDLASICHADTLVLGDCIEEIVVAAISYHLLHNKDPEYRNGKLLISSKSLTHGLSIFQDGKSGESFKMEKNAESLKGGEEAIGAKSEGQGPENKGDGEKSLSFGKKDSENTAPVKEIPPDNEFEKRIRPEVIPASEIGVTFADIGALTDIKESLQELVMLPLRRPDLFKGGLLKPCRGILLFGPPGTGKTMLAKAIANEAGASFINVSMSTITSKWFGEDEKNVRALFTLAAKVSPTIIFVDEVDSMLGQRTRVGEHEAMRKIKNEFMSHWDGLLTKPGERILVLAATNRPFDLDEAIIRRFERRIMVSLPSIESREMILKTLLAKEKVETLDFKELAVMTEGYSGSDLKNLCITAAYRPVRELLQQEREKEKDKKKNDSEGSSSSSEESSATKEEDKEEKVITLRTLNMEDMRQAKNQVAASFASEGSIMNDLKQWNELYGEGGSRKKEQLTYFL